MPALSNDAASRLLAPTPTASKETHRRGSPPRTLPTTATPNSSNREGHACPADTTAKAVLERAFAPNAGRVTT